MAAGVGAHHLEGFVHCQAGALGEDAFGLFELDAAGEGGLQLVASSSLAAMARSWISPTVATSAVAWPMLRSPG